MEKVTIYDIAKKTGFSVGTVSKALNNYKGVSEKARNAVQLACAEMNFTPNSTAQTLATKKSNLIGYVFSETLGGGLLHPHFVQILQSFKTEVEASGYDLLLINSKTTVGNGFYEHCLHRQIDGALIAIPRTEAGRVESLINSSIPCVSIEDTYSKAPSVISDNRGGTLQMLTHLYALGHRKIAYIAAPQDGVPGWERYNAYIQFMTERGLPINDNHIVFATNYTRKAGYSAAEKLLGKCWEELPTAVFSAYDELSYAMQDTLERRGYRVPDEISVAGFDDILISQCATPKLTTIAQNRDAIGKLAGQLLLRRMDGNTSVENIIHRIPTSLVVRESTRRILDQN